MRIVTLLFLLLTGFIGNAQSLPIDFESFITTSFFTNFSGGTGTVISNPQSGGINTSATVAQIVRDGGEIWAGSKLTLDNNLDFTTMNQISMKVFTTAPVGTTIKFKLEGTGETERDVQTTVSNEWETLVWDFTGEPSNFRDLVFMFDFGNVGDGSINSTFLFDDIELLFGGFQIDFPVDFEGSEINYTTTDFGGNVSSLVNDPVNANNKVIKVIKTAEAATWAGTTIGTPAGFATNLPLTLTDSKMTVRVWSPDAGIPVRLKVEDSSDPTHTCETETLTTLAGEWELLEFDFLNQAPGTELLEIGLNMGWTYNMASIFFNFATDGATAGEKTYYFDNIAFGDFIISTNDFQTIGLAVYPNPADEQWTISGENANISEVEIFDIQGRALRQLYPNSNSVNINAAHFPRGIYIARMVTDLGVGTVRLVKE